MKQVLRAVVGAVTMVGLLGTTAVAHATVIGGAASTAFVAHAPSEAQFIDRMLARSVTNTDPVNAHNFVANLGVVTGTGVAPTVNVYAWNHGTDTMTCWVIAVRMSDGTDQAPAASLSHTNSPTVLSIGLPILGNGTKYALNLFCAVPRNSSTYIYGASVDI